MLISDAKLRRSLARPELELELKLYVARLELELELKLELELRELRLLSDSGLRRPLGSVSPLELWSPSTIFSIVRSVLPHMPAFTSAAAAFGNRELNVASLSVLRVTSRR